MNPEDYIAAFDGNGGDAVERRMMNMAVPPPSTDPPPPPAAPTIGTVVSDGVAGPSTIKGKASATPSCIPNDDGGGSTDARVIGPHWGHYINSTYGEQPLIDNASLRQEEEEEAAAAAAEDPRPSSQMMKTSTSDAIDLLGRGAKGRDLFGKLAELKPMASSLTAHEKKNSISCYKKLPLDHHHPVEFVSDPPLLWFSIEDSDTKSPTDNFNLTEFAELNGFELGAHPVKATMAALYGRENQMIKLHMPHITTVVEDKTNERANRHPPALLHGSLALVGIRSARMNNCIAAFVAIQSERHPETESVDACVLSAFRSPDANIDPSKWEGAPLAFEKQFDVLSVRLKSSLRVHGENRAFLAALFDARRLPRISTLESRLLQNPSLVRLDDDIHSRQQKRKANSTDFSNVDYKRDGAKTALFQTYVQENLGGPGKVIIGGNGWIRDAWVEAGKGKRKYSKYCVTVKLNDKEETRTHTVQKNLVQELRALKNTGGPSIQEGAPPSTQAS